MSSFRQNLVDLTPLRNSPAFARLWIGAALSGIGAQMTIMAVGLQIYDITHNTFMVGLVGGIALVPMLFAGPWGGMLADSMDRRSVIMGALTTSWISTLGLLVMALAEWKAQSLGGHVVLWPFYLFTTINAMAQIVSGAARKAVYPRILEWEDLPKANALNGISMGAQLTVGPAVAGILVAALGFPATFTVDLLLAIAGFLGVVMLPKIPPLGEKVIAGWNSIKSGLVFLLRAPNIRTSFLVDIIAMGLGRPYALLPAVASLVVGGGPTSVGILTASAAVGTFFASVFSGPVNRTNRYGVAIIGAVTAYGFFVAGLGLVVLGGMFHLYGAVGPDWSEVNSLALALAALCFFGMGASDEISSIFRTTLLMTAAPDDMRGRLQGVFFSVVGGGPRLGDLFTGVLAASIALWAPALIGGIGIVVAMTLLLRMNPRFRSFDFRNPEL